MSAKLVEELFNKIKNIVRENALDTSKPGVWAADEVKDYKDVLFRMYDGGYTSVLSSKKYNFTIAQGYTSVEGTSYDVKGEIEDIKKCLKDLDTPKSAI